MTVPFHNERCAVCAHSAEMHGSGVVTDGKCSSGPSDPCTCERFVMSPEYHEAARAGA